MAEQLLHVTPQHLRALGLLGRGGVLIVIIYFFEKNPYLPVWFVVTVILCFIYWLVKSLQLKDRHISYAKTKRVDKDT